MPGQARKGNRQARPGEVEDEKVEGGRLRTGRTFANAMTKTCLHREWAMDEVSAIEAEAQAICMHTRDCGRACRAFVAKGKPLFEGN